MRALLSVAGALLALTPAWSQVVTSPEPDFSVGTSTASARKSQVFVGDLFVGGRMGVGTQPGLSRLAIRATTDTGTAFVVSGVDETPFLAVSSSGKVGIGTLPTAALDIMSSSEFGPGAALMLRNENERGTTNLYQMTFGFGDKGRFRHAIRTSRSDPRRGGGTLDFLIWGPETGSEKRVARRAVLSLQNDLKATEVQILPAGDGGADLVVSDGKSNGGGTLHRRRELVPAGKESIADVVYLGEAEELKAFLAADRLRYSSARQLSFDTAPAGVQRSGGFISLDGRVMNAELAAKELIRRVEQLEASVDRLGSRP